MLNMDIFFFLYFLFGYTTSKQTNEQASEHEILMIFIES